MTVQQILKFALFTILILNLTKEIDPKPTQNSTSDNEIKINDFETESTRENEIKIDDDREFRSQYAHKMMTFMNLSVSPCDDFYEYACGNWKNVIEERQTPYKRSNLIDISYILADHVENLLQRSTESLELDYASELKVAQKFYNICLAADLYPMKKSDAYLEVIKSIGGFPATDDTWLATADNFSWFNMSAHLSNYGVSGLINEQIMPAYPFPPYFKLPNLGFDYIVHTDNILSNNSRGYKLNEKRMREYLTTYDVDESRISQIIEDIFEFWRAVLQLADQFKEDLDQCLTLSAVNQTEPFPQWDNYFAIAWKGMDFNVSSDDCPCDFFYQNLDTICGERKEAVGNYLAMKFLYNLDARLKDKKFQKEYCVTTAQFAFPYLFDKLYLAEHFSEKIQAEVSTIITEIRKSLVGILKDSDWLDETTRAQALLKESTIISRVGSFEDPEFTERLIREMNNITFVDDYEQNNLALRKFKMFLKRYNGLYYEQLDEKTAKPQELLIAMQVNSFYYMLDNSINVMAGILHPPAYHKAWPNALKFGTLGYLIGHEFTHGFDSVGAYFDSSGDERYWWSKKSGKVFDERAKCYVNQYNEFLIPEINRNVNGNETKDENIADSGGLREALSAYRGYMKKLTKEDPAQQSSIFVEEQMPGLDLSPEQIFFLGFAQVWCAAYKEEHYWEELTDEHTMNKYRVLGAVTNYDEFAKVYDCPIGSKMNPKSDKCRVW